MPLPGRPSTRFSIANGKEIDAADRQEIVRRAAARPTSCRRPGSRRRPRAAHLPARWSGVRRELLRVHAPGGSRFPVASPTRGSDRELPKLRHIAEDSRRTRRLTHAKYRALTTLASVRDGVAGAARPRDGELAELACCCPSRQCARIRRRPRPGGPRGRPFRPGRRRVPAVHLRLDAAPGRRVVCGTESDAQSPTDRANTRVDASRCSSAGALFHDMGLPADPQRDVHRARCIAFSSMTFLPPRVLVARGDRSRSRHAHRRTELRLRLRFARSARRRLVRPLVVRSTLQGGEPMLAATMDRFEAG